MIEASGVAVRPRSASKGPSDGYCRAAWTAVCRSQAVIEFAPDGTITWANDNFLAPVGYTSAQLVGHHHRLLCFEEHACSAEYRALWARLGAGEFVQAEFQRRRRDGRALWLQASYNLIFDRDGVARRVLKVATDITRQVQLEREAQTFRDALEERGTVLKVSRGRMNDIVSTISRIAAEVRKLAGDTRAATDRAATLVAAHD